MLVKSPDVPSLCHVRGLSCRLLGSYERMESPSPHKVDANGTKEEVLAAVLKVIQDKLSTVSP